MSRDPLYRARARALQYIYMYRLNPPEEGGATLDPGASDLEVGEPLKGSSLRHFSLLVEAVQRGTGNIQSIWEPYSSRQPEQLDPVTWALLCVGAAELSRCEKIPVRVTLDQMVSLAHEYAPEEAFRYINAVLDRCARSLGRLTDAG